MPKEVAEYTLAEEVVNAVTYGAGVILSILGLTWMLYLSIGSADPWRIVSSCIYGTSLISLFLASTIYHGFYASRHKHVLKLLDHCAIYILIAGTYTPFLLVAMRNNTGWWLFGTVWTLATAGVLTKLWFKHRYRIWMIASVCFQLSRHLAVEWRRPTAVSTDRRNPKQTFRDHRFGASYISGK